MTNHTALGDYERFVKPHWSDNELANFAVVARFMSTVRSGPAEHLLAEYGDHPYRQHNPGMSNGIDGVAEEIQKVGVEAPDFFVDTKHAYVDGEYVIIQAHFTAIEDHRGDDRHGFNAVDIWKIVEGKIVEHWDAIQPLEPTDRNNDNGIF